MKRILAILLGLTYVVTTSGLAVAKHYCAGKLESVRLTGAGHCGCEKTGKDNSCCKDEVIVIKLSDEHTVAKTAVPDLRMDVMFLPLTGLLLPEVIAQVDCYPSAWSDAPGPPLFLSSGSLRC